MSTPVTHTTQQQQLTEQQAAEQQRLSLVEKVRASIIHASKTYDVPQEIIWVNESPIATFGNFSVTTGKAKSRKTFNVSALVAAVLANGTVLGYRAKLPDNKRRILYIDTEQSQFHCHRVLQRILALAGLPPNVDTPYFELVGWRDSTPKERRDMVEIAIEERKDDLGLVVIDGIRDMMLDINDSQESVLLVNDLMRWSSMYNIHIHVALHLNKSDDNVRGHIGTETNNKAETVLLVAKDRYDSNMSEVSPLYVRDKEFKAFHFLVNENGLPEDVYGYRSPKTEKKDSLDFSKVTEEQHKTALDNAFAHGVINGKNKTMAALMKAYADVGFERGMTTWGKQLEHLEAKGTIVQQGKHVYCLKADFPTLGLEDSNNNSKE